MIPIDQCQTCGMSLAQRDRGRHRKFCSDACRYAAVAARKASRDKPPKPSHCAICGGPIVQPKTGRPRTTCTTCSVPRKPVQNALLAV